LAVNSCDESEKCFIVLYGYYTDGDFRDYLIFLSLIDMVEELRQ